MSAPTVYHRVYQMIKAQVGKGIDESSLVRLALFVTGAIKAKSASPAQVAQSLAQMQLTGAQAKSIERRIRRMENDPEITADICFHPFARHHLLLAGQQELVLILDPTTQEDKLVMVSVSVWYRGRALPLVWTTWPGNQPLEGASFWERIDQLLREAQKILPGGVSVTMLADRAFGCPTFIDLVLKRQWHYVLRIQGQTHCRDRMGREQPVESLVPARGQRVKLQGQAFKTAGWRPVGVVVYWGRRYPQPLCLVSDLSPDWSLIRLYRRRYPIEASFRDYKSHGWRWEQGQVTDPQHVERLLVAMALATWLALLAGCHRAREILSKPPTGRRRTCPWEGKLSLFQHGLNLFHACLFGSKSLPERWFLSDWEAPNWKRQLSFKVARAFVFA